MFAVRHIKSLTKSMVEHDGGLRIDWGGQYGGVISISSVLEIGRIYRPGPTRR